jgi:sterol desaturase/sphingolipid hydroxylase (fatty acid hydroxylase superfamily)
VEIALAAVLMDYTLYIWHRLMHRSGLIWRFHLPHHMDLDLDASTALRFHFSELVLSVPWRAGQVLVIGVSPVALSIWQKALMFSILFHHSNVRLPIEFEQWLCRLIVTPRLHGIHHSIIRAEEELLQRLDALGRASRHPEAQRSAARDHDRPASVPRPAKTALARCSDDAV